MTTSTFSINWKTKLILNLIRISLSRFISMNWFSILDAKCSWREQQRKLLISITFQIFDCKKNHFLQTQPDMFFKLNHISSPIFCISFLTNCFLVICLIKHELTNHYYLHNTNYLVSMWMLVYFLSKIQQNKTATFEFNYSILSVNSSYKWHLNV
jgi:hypothetical protein